VCRLRTSSEKGMRYRFAETLVAHAGEADFLRDAFSENDTVVSSALDYVVLNISN